MATGSGRRTQTWVNCILDADLREDEFVEIVGVAIMTIAMDAFCDGHDKAPAPLPDPRPGAPRGYYTLLRHRVRDG